MADLLECLSYIIVTFFFSSFDSINHHHHRLNTNKLGVSTYSNNYFPLKVVLVVVFPALVRPEGTVAICIIPKYEFYDSKEKGMHFYDSKEKNACTLYFILLYHKLIPTANIYSKE